MPWVKLLFRSVGEAVAARGLRALAGTVPFGTVVYEIAAAALERFRYYQNRDQVRTLVEEAVRAASAPAPPADPVRALLDGLATGPGSWLLDWTNKQVGDDGIRALAANPALAKRTMLYLSGNRITDAGARALAASPHLAGVTRLVLWDNQIGDAGVAALAASPHLANLTSLDLGRNHVGDAGARALADSPHLASLSALILVSNRIGDAGALALAESRYLADLAELKPLNNHIGAAGVTALRERFGKRVRIY